MCLQRQGSCYVFLEKATRFRWERVRCYGVPFHQALHDLRPGILGSFFPCTCNRPLVRAHPSSTFGLLCLKTHALPCTYVRLSFRVPSLSLSHIPLRPRRSISSWLTLVVPVVTPIVVALPPLGVLVLLVLLVLPTHHARRLMLLRRRTLSWWLSVRRRRRPPAALPPSGRRSVVTAPPRRPSAPSCSVRSRRRPPWRTTAGAARHLSPGARSLLLRRSGRPPRLLLLWVLETLLARVVRFLRGGWCLLGRGGVLPWSSISSQSIGRWASPASNGVPPSTFPCPRLLARGVISCLGVPGITSGAAVRLSSWIGSVLSRLLRLLVLVLRLRPRIGGWRRSPSWRTLGGTAHRIRGSHRRGRCWCTTQRSCRLLLLLLFVPGVRRVHSPDRRRSLIDPIGRGSGALATYGGLLLRHCWPVAAHSPHGRPAVTAADATLGRRLFSRRRGAIAIRPANGFASPRGRPFLPLLRLLLRLLLLKGIRGSGHLGRRRSAFDSVGLVDGGVQRYRLGSGGGGGTIHCAASRHPVQFALRVRHLRLPSCRGGEGCRTGDGGRKIRVQTGG